jgi:hypothetical protein
LIGAATRHDWNVDTRKPATTIASGPSGLTPNDSVTFILTSDEPGSQFYCRLDAKPWGGCPASVSFASLSEGSHTLDAVAVDRAGNADPSQEHRYFEVRTVPATPSLAASTASRLGAARAQESTRPPGRSKRAPTGSRYGASARRASLAR